MNWRMIGGRHVLDSVVSRRTSHASAGPATMLPAMASSSVGATLPSENAVSRHRADGQPVDQQRGRVVQEALALEDRQDPMRRPELPQNRGRRRGVGRRDDGAERDRRRPRHRRHERPRDHGDRDRRQARRSRRRGSPPAPSCPSGPAARRRRPRPAAPARRRAPAPGRDRSRSRRARHESQHGAAEGEKRRIRRADTPRHRGEEDGDEQDGEERFEAGHREEDYRTRVSLYVSPRSDSKRRCEAFTSRFAASGPTRPKDAEPAPARFVV